MVAYELDLQAWVRHQRKEKTGAKWSSEIDRMHVNMLGEVPAWGRHS